MHNPGDFPAIGYKKLPRRFWRDDVEKAPLGDIAPLEIVRPDPIADNDVGAGVKGRSNIRADDPGPASNHVHARSPPFCSANGAHARRAASKKSAAAPSTPELPAGAIRIPLTPAAAAASMSASPSPMRTASLGPKPRSRIALLTMPGAGFRQSQ